MDKYQYDDKDRLPNIAYGICGASGRLVKEGEKTYEYGWLDKVMRVAEDGKELARFEYHNNNQLAKAIRESWGETFELDGLALIERNGTKYINEPHAGGGNPVLAIDTLGDVQNTETIFTDILGTSLGKIGDDGYSAIEKTVFGDANKKGFFTGKPYVDELGYAFLFRNYRADIGKWLSQDLIGYPDGWNNLAYCNNDIINIIDLFGALNLNLYPKGSDIAANAGKCTTFDRMGFSVGIHGDANGVSPTGNANDRMSASDLAKSIKDAGWNGTDTIYLLSCNVGNGDFAQELADALGEGARVQAPDGYIWFDKDGKAYLGDMDENGNYKPNPDKKFKGSVGKGSSGQASAGE